jgi:hypothetical protein
VRPCAPIALALVALAGCGGSAQKPEDAARATVQRYLSALGRGDAAAACGELTAASREKLAEVGRARLRLRARSCTATIDAALHAGNGDQLRRLGHARVTRVAMQGDSAEVAVEGIGRLTRVVRSGGAWRIETEPAGEIR